MAKATFFTKNTFVSTDKTNDKKYGKGVYTLCKAICIEQLIQTQPDEAAEING